ncbi:UPF0176 protein [Friedmanniella luteola]|uniref:UPF0176 protein n=1 Tax=Friedmanniella luteola TaxID=546871 RepID=A0A1H1LGM3_9ACTN|nr:UPF0176 protein [Friedmanniella luteola]
MVSTTLLLYYGLRPVPDPHAVALWQRELAARCRVWGSVVVAPHGMAADLGGPPDRLETYARATREHPAFADLDLRLVHGQGEPRPRLSVTVRDELVGFGAPHELRVERGGLVGAGERLGPHGLHELVATRGDEVVLLDGRHRHEAEVGRFAGARRPDADSARDVLARLDAGAYDGLRDRPVVTYCTSGIRAELLSALMRNRGFREVYRLDGGILAYGRTFADDGLWEGALYVLQERVRVTFSDHPAVLGSCETCGAPTYAHRDCVAPLCRGWALLCNACADFALCAAHRN